MATGKLMEIVRAKFYVDSVTTHAPYKGKQGGTVRLCPVYSPDPNSENKKFWDATPSGLIEMTVMDLTVLAGFTPGQKFYVEFLPADD